MRVKMSKTSEFNSEPDSGEGMPGLAGAPPAPGPLIDDSDRKLRQLVHELTVLSGRIDQVRTRFARRLGISGPQYNVLQFVAQNQGSQGITVSKVADGLLVTGAYVTKEVNQLISRGFVVKTPNPDDGRSVLLKLTDYGTETLAALAPALQTVNDQMFKSLDQDRLLAFSGTVHRILKDAEKTARKISYYLDE